MLEHSAHARTSLISLNVSENSEIVLRPKGKSHLEPHSFFAFDYRDLVIILRLSIDSLRCFTSVSFPMAVFEICFHFVKISGSLSGKCTS